MSPDDQRGNDVSVVMATFNGARFIEEQLRSILAQTLPPREILVGDDGSSDDTVRIIERVAADSPIPIHVVENERTLGYGDNFLRTASRARSRYIAFADQDDVWDPRKLERSVNALQQPGVRIVAHQMNLIDQHGVFIRLDTHGTRRTVRIPAGRADPFGVFFGFTMTFERTLLDILPAADRGRDSFKPSMPLAHDRWVYFLGTAFGDAVLLAEPLAGYRQHGTQSFGIILSTRRARFVAKLARGRMQAETLAEIAAQRRALIDRHRPTVGSDAAPDERWELAARRWARVQAFTDRRASTYAASTLPARIGHMTVNALAGAYRSHRAGGLGGQHVAEDVAVGVFGPILRRVSVVSKAPAR